jgi:hypothetical protein
MVIFTNFLKRHLAIESPKKNHFIFAISFMNFVFWQNFASEEKGCHQATNMPNVNCK